MNVQKPLLKAGMKVIKKTKGEKNAETESKMYASIPTAMADILKSAADVKNAHAEIKKVLKKNKRVEEKTEANHAHGEFLLNSAIAKLRKADKLLADTESKNAHADYLLTCASAKLREADQLLADAQRAAASLRRLMLRLPKAVRKIGGGLMGLGGLVVQALIVTGGAKVTFSACVACMDWGALPPH
jgi:hypothetical protein